MRRIPLFLFLILLFSFYGCNKDKFEDIPIEGVDSRFHGLRVLWLGTSIPQGCIYPAFSCWKLGMWCTNRSKGESMLCFLKKSEKSLTATVNEIEELYRDSCWENKMSAKQFGMLKSCSYETLLMPDIKDFDVVVIDHGYNDIDGINNIPSQIDWDTMDRTNFIGAFNYLYAKIKEENPQIKVIIGGYFQNTCTIGYSGRGGKVSNVLELISAHYNIPLLKVWDETTIPDGYAPCSENYLDSLNAIYGTSFEKWNPNERGEITYFQKFCPDTVHPFSDPTGNSDRILNIAVTRQLYKALLEAYASETAQ